jgi:hypothetical protein
MKLFKIWKKSKKSNKKTSNVTTLKNKKELLVCSTCKPNPSEKYSKRPAPSCHADDCRDMIREGNDKRVYISKPDKRGIYKWILTTDWDEIRLPPKNNTYYTHDNGSRPFKVVISKGGRRVDIYKCIYPKKSWKLSKAYRYVLYYEYALGFDVLRVILGTDPDDLYENNTENIQKWIGNSILAEISRSKYLYIGESVFTFNTSLESKSPITKYISPVGNNDVPYPFALDSEFAYLMIENVKILISNLDMNQKPFDPYTQYYEYRNYKTIDVKLHSAKVHSVKLDKTELIARLD